MTQDQKLPLLTIAGAESTIERLRIRYLQLVLIALVLAGLAITIATIFNGQTLLNGANVINPIGDLANLQLWLNAINITAPILALTSLLALFFVSRKQLILTTSAIIIAFFILTGVFLFIITQDVNLLFLLLSVAMLSTALLSSQLNYRITTVSILLSIIACSFIGVINADTPIFDDLFVSLLLTLAFGIVPIVIGASARYFITELEITTQRAQRSASLLAASADIGQNVSEVLELDELLQRAVTIIRDRFAFYHVSIFLSDSDNRYTHLTASTGDVGERMLARGHRLLIDANSVVGRSTQAQDVIVVRNTENESGHAYNELLPDARSELAIPIMNNTGVIGIIDIQSLRPDAFSVSEIEALRVIANQLATAISNTRLFADKENSIRENKRLFIESETNLREIQRLNRQLTKQAWTDYLLTDRRIDGVTLSEDRFRNQAEWSDDMITASQKRRAITEDKDGIRKIAVPIELRGEVVGAIELETSQTRNKDDVIDMVRTISQRLGVSLDNARLFEESNEATAQEQRVSEIVAQYQSADSVDDLLRLTVQGLAETLGADYASIRLGIVPDISPLNATDDTTANGDISI